MRTVGTGRIGLEAAIGPGVRKFRVLATVVGLFLFGYLAATLLGMAQSTSSLVFTVFMLPMPFFAWWTYTRTPPELRRLWLLLASAATLWFLGSVVWYGFYLANGSVVPEPPGLWDVFFLLGRILVIFGVIVAMRAMISFRIATLDAVAVVASGVAVSAVFIGREFGDGVSFGSLVTLNRPILSIITLMLIVSAVAGSWQGVPFSTALIGLAEAGITVGSLVYSYQAVQGEFVDDRWANIPWAAGAGVSYLAASVIVLRIDRPLRISSGAFIPNQPVASAGILAVSLAALALVLAVAAYGLATGSRVLAAIGLGAGFSIGAAMALRARDALKVADTAYRTLNSEQIELERRHDRLYVDNEELSHANAHLQTRQVMMAEGFNLLDALSEGRIRALAEETSDELVRFLEPYIDEGCPGEEE